MKRIGFVGWLLISSLAVWGQARTTTQAGAWSNPATWGGNPAPTFSVGTITISHAVTIDAADYPIASPLEVDQFAIGATGVVTVNTGAALLIRAGGGTDMTLNASADLIVQSGAELILNPSVAHTGTTASNTTFASGAILRTATATLPTATGYGGIDVYIQGATGALTFGTSWSQLTATTDLFVNCPDLGNSAISLAGNITSIASLTVSDTDGATGGRIVLGSGTTNLSIGAGGISVDGDSRLFVSTGANTVNVTTTGNVTFSPDNTALFSQFATTGTGTLTLNGGNYTMDSGAMRMSSTGIGTLTMNGGDVSVSGGTWEMASGNGGDAFFVFGDSSDLLVTAGIFQESGGGASQGTFTFSGSTGNQSLNLPPSSVGTGTLNLVVNKSSGGVTVSNTLAVTGLTLTNGTLILAGNGLTVSGALAATSGSIDATTASSVSITGTGALAATVPFVIGSQLNNLTLNRTGVTLTVSNVSMANNGLVTRTVGSFGAAIPGVGVYDVRYSNTGTITTGPELPTSTTLLRNLEKQGAGTLNLAANVTINGNLTTATGAGTFAAGAFNVSLVGDFLANANFTMSTTSLFTFLPRVSPSNAHSLSGTGTTVSFGRLTVDGALTVSRNLTTGGNITINSGSSVAATTGIWTVSTTSAITNNGTSLAFNALTVSTGASLTAPLNGTFSIAGNFTSPGTFVANGSTVVFNGTTALSAVETYNNITVSNGATLTSAFGLNVAGSVINNGSISFTAGTLTWNSNGTFSGTTSATINNLTVSATRTFNLTLTAALTISNNLVLTGSFNQTSTNDVSIGGSISGNGNFSSAGRVIFTGVSAALGGLGTKSFTSMRVTGTVTAATTSSYQFINTGTIDVPGTLTTTNGTSTVTIAGNTSIISNGRNIVLNNLLISGTLTAADTITLNRNFTNNGTFNHGNGTIAFSTATTAKSINASASTTFFNLLVRDNGSATDVTNNITTGSVNLAGVLNVLPSAVFDADGASDNLSFVLRSTDDDPANDASIGPLLSSAAVSGNFTVQRFVSVESVPRLYRFISSPVEGATVASWQDDIFVTGTFVGAHNGTTPGCTGCTTSASSFYYNAGTQAYVTFPTPVTGSSSDALVSGRGYSVFFRQNLHGNVTLDYTGTHPPTGANIPLTVSSSAGGFSLVGNPYPAPLLWSNTGWVKSASMSDFIRVRDNVSGVFVEHDITDGSGVIATGQAFWIETLNTLTTPSLAVNEQAKTSTQVSGGAFYRTTSEETSIEGKVVLRLKKQTNNITNNAEDRAVLRVLAGTLASVDSKDASKWDNYIPFSSDSVQVQDLAFRLAGNERVGINSVPSIDCGGQTFELSTTNLINPAYAGIPAETTVQYSLTFESLGVLQGLPWVLHDNHTNSDIDLSTSGVYQFTVVSSSASSYSSDRFTLRTLPQVLNTSVPVTVSSSQICDGTDAVVKVDDSQKGITYKIELNEMVTSISAVGNNDKISIFVDNELLQPGTNSIRVIANSGCEQQFLAAAIEVSKQPLAQAIAEDVNACADALVMLQASGAPSGGSYAWYASTESTDVLSSEATYTTSQLFDTTVFYVAAVNELGCEGERVPVSANIRQYETTLEVSQAAVVCQQQTAVLSATGADASASYRWYASATDDQPLASTAEFTTAPLAATTSFFVSSVDQSGCESSRLEVIAEVIVFDPAFDARQINTVCYSGEVQLETDQQEGIVFQWFETETASEPIAVGNLFSTPVLASNNRYYVRAVNSNGCRSEAQEIEALVYIGNPSQDLIVQSETICMGDNATLQADATNAESFKWYAQAQSVLPVHEGSSFVTDVMQQSATYYVAGVSDEGCEGERVEVQVPVTTYAMPAIELVSEVELKANHTENIQWYYNGNVLPNETNQSLTMNESGRYGFSVSVNGCEAYTDAVFEITSIEELLSSRVEVYPNPAQRAVFVSNQADVAVEVELMGLQGNLLNTFKVQSGAIHEIDVQGLPKGMYMLHVFSNNSSAVKKIIIE